MNCHYFRMSFAAIVTCTLRGLDTLGRFCAIFYKGDNFYALLFVFLHTKRLLKRGYSKRKEFEQMLSF